MTLNDNNTKKSLSFQFYVTKINEKKNPGTNELHDFQNIPIARINSFIEALYSAGKIFHYKIEGKMGDVCDGVVSRLIIGHILGCDIACFFLSSNASSFLAFWMSLMFFEQFIHIFT